MKYLFIGGTGNMSMYITKQLLKDGHTVVLVNRGSRNEELDALGGDVRYITADINREEEKVAEAIRDESFDAVADFIVFNTDQAARDFRLFSGKCKQYLVLSTASVYKKPLASPYVTEGTPMGNPYWTYSQNKTKMEEYFMERFREDGFPVTIIRPSHTYGDHYFPVAVEGRYGGYQILLRMLRGKPIIVHGDGTSLWTFTHSSDFAKGFIGLLHNVHAIGEAFHITSDEQVTWDQMFRVAAEELGVEAKIVHISSDFLADVDPRGNIRGTLTGDKANSVIFDNTKLKRAVPGFEATVRMDQGIRETVRFIMSHQELYHEDPEYDAWCDAVIEAREAAADIVREKMNQLK